MRVLLTLGSANRVLRPFVENAQWFVASAGALLGSFHHGFENRSFGEDEWTRAGRILHSEVPTVENTRIAGLTRTF